MTPAAIRDGFERLRADDELLPLADAATCRSESDWLVGINGTRAMTAFNSKSGGFHKTPVGRVQTPTLAILVEREEKIKRFVSRDYWEVHGDVRRRRAANTRAAGSTRTSRRTSATKTATCAPSACGTKQRALDIRDRCDGQPGEITEESKPSTQLSPLLFDLTSLQRAANGRFGFSARMTLSIAQALYEKHKVLTYPADRLARAARRLHRHGQGDAGSADRRRRRARRRRASVCGFRGEDPRSSKWVQAEQAHFQQRQGLGPLRDHPDRARAQASERGRGEALRPRRAALSAVFYPAAEYLVTTRITRVAGEPFKSEGKVLKQAGWLEVHGKEVQEDDEAQPRRRSRPGETAAHASQSTSSPTQTKPPARFTEATLLTAMEGAGKLVEDEELRDAMKERGLGTPATRAVDHREADRRRIRPAQRPRAAADAEGVFADHAAARPGDSRAHLARADRRVGIQAEGDGARQALARRSSCSGIADMTRHIVERAKAHESDTVPGDFATLDTPCPKCGGVVKENYKKFQCQNCDFALWRILVGPPVRARGDRGADREARRSVRCRASAAGWASRLPRSSSSRRSSSSSSISASSRATATASRSTSRARSRWARARNAASSVYAHGMAYICENAAASPRTCDFRSGKIILQRPIETEQMKKLLTEGKTDLLHRFISKKGRPFSAFLVQGRGRQGRFRVRAARGGKDAGEDQDGDPRAQSGCADQIATSRELTRRSEQPTASEGYGGKPALVVSRSGTRRRLRGSLDVEVAHAQRVASR